MAIIEKRNSVLTLINVFSVEPGKQQQLVELLIDATSQTMRHLPGFERIEATFSAIANCWTQT